MRFTNLAQLERKVKLNIRGEDEDSRVSLMNQKSATLYVNPGNIE